MWIAFFPLGEGGVDCMPESPSYYIYHPKTNCLKISEELHCMPSVSSYPASIYNYVVDATQNAEEKYK